VFLAALLLLACKLESRARRELPRIWFGLTTTPDVRSIDLSSIRKHSSTADHPKPKDIMQG
jgi:hypothetical protein